MSSVITVDGLAGSGKTTLSKLLSERLGWGHFNSGSLYRTVGWLAVRSSLNPDNEEVMATELAKHSVRVHVVPGLGTRIELDGTMVTVDLTTAEISDATSRSSRHARIRSALIQLQRDLATTHNLVAEGRDMGTIIFPQAPIKFFITASEEVRAERRLRQWREAGSTTGPSESELKQQLVREIRERDERDSSRLVAPTKAAVDGVAIDNSGPSLTQVVESMYSLARARGLV